MSTAPSLVLADDSALLREGLAGLLERQGYDVVDWNSDQVAHDVLDHYERWLEYVGTSEKTESRYSRRL